MDDGSTSHLAFDGSVELWRCMAIFWLAGEGWL